MWSGCRAQQEALYPTTKLLESVPCPKKALCGPCRGQTPQSPTSKASPQFPLQDAMKSWSLRLSAGSVRVHRGTAHAQGLAVSRSPGHLLQPPILSSMCERVGVRGGVTGDASFKANSLLQSLFSAFPLLPSLEAWEGKDQPKNANFQDGQAPGVLHGWPCPTSLPEAQT